MLTEKVNRLGKKLDNGGVRGDIIRGSEQLVWETRRMTRVKPLNIFKKILT